MGVGEYVASLADNPYFGAGAGLFGVGAGLAVLRRGASVALIVMRRRYLISIEVSNEDRCYDWLLQWINVRAAQSTRHRSVQTSYSQSESGHVSTQFDFVPSPGEHYLFYHGRIIKVERSREKQMVKTASLGVQGTPYETVSMTTFGTDADFYVRIVEEARRLALARVRTGTVIYQAFGHEWRQFGHPRRRRPLASVVLDEGVSERIVDDAREFIGSAKWYMERGVPYRRGYLLYGPPGCGKSSFITALAGELGYSICLLSLSDPTLTDDRLHYLLNTAPLQSIVLLEDVDVAYGGREKSAADDAAYAGLTRVSGSGLLNALDGVASSEARILFMTTNNVDVLKPALIRPGRVDLRQFVGPCTEHQLAALFRQFYAHADAPQLVERFVQAARPFTPSAAEVQSLFLAHKDDGAAAVALAAKHITKLRETESSAAPVSSERILGRRRRRSRTGHNYRCGKVA